MGFRLKNCTLNGYYLQGRTLSARCFIKRENILFGFFFFCLFVSFLLYFRILYLFSCPKASVWAFEKTNFDAWHYANGFFFTTSLLGKKNNKKCQQSNHKQISFYLQIRFHHVRKSQSKNDVVNVHFVKSSRHNALFTENFTPLLLFWFFFFESYGAFLEQKKKFFLYSLWKGKQKMITDTSIGSEKPIEPPKEPVVNESLVLEDHDSAALLFDEVWNFFCQKPFFLTNEMINKRFCRNTKKWKWKY